MMNLVLDLLSREV